MNTNTTNNNKNLINYYAPTGTQSSAFYPNLGEAAQGIPSAPKLDESDFANFSAPKSLYNRVVSLETKAKSELTNGNMGTASMLLEQVVFFTLKHCSIKNAKERAEACNDDLINLKRLMDTVSFNSNSASMHVDKIAKLMDHYLDELFAKHDECSNKNTRERINDILNLKATVLGSRDESMFRYSDLWKSKDFNKSYSDIDSDTFLSTRLENCATQVQKAFFDDGKNHQEDIDNLIQAFLGFILKASQLGEYDAVVEFQSSNLLQCCNALPNSGNSIKTINSKINKLSNIVIDTMLLPSKNESHKSIMEGMQKVMSYNLEQSKLTAMFHGLTNKTINMLIRYFIIYTTLSFISYCIMGNK